MNTATISARFKEEKCNKESAWIDSAESVNSKTTNTSNIIAFDFGIRIQKLWMSRHMSQEILSKRLAAVNP